jgi:hypothetical protein
LSTKLYICCMYSTVQMQARIRIGREATKLEIL